MNKISLVWKDKNLTEFMKNHEFVDSNELNIVEFKKLIFSIIESFLEKKITVDEFLDLAFSLWSPDNDSDDKEIKEIKGISYLLSELSYSSGSIIEDHFPIITEKNKDQEMVYPYDVYMNEILRYYLDHKNDKYRDLE